MANTYGAPGADRGGVHPLQADAALHPGIDRARHPGGAGAAPREEPQIIVPMVDVFVEMPGATPADVEQRVTRPLEQLLWEVPGVEYLYSTSSPGQSMVIVRFTVDEPQEAALVRLNQKLAAHADRMPPGSSDRSSSRGRSMMCRSLPSPCGRRATRTISCDRSRSNCEMQSPR